MTTTTRRATLRRVIRAMGDPDEQCPECGDDTGDGSICTPCLRILRAEARSDARD